VDLGLTGKRAVVTGGSGGIGRAVATALAREGCEVVLASRTRRTLEDAAAGISAEVGRVVHAVPVDTGDDDSVRRMVDDVTALLGGVDVLVNNAAKPLATGSSSTDGLTGDVFWEDMNVKAMGYVRCAQAVAPGMIAAGWGRIINISGLGARHTAAAMLGSMRNVAVAAMTKHLADELGPHGINVTVVHPGRTRTEATEALVEKVERARDLTREQAERRVAGNSIRRIVEVTEVADVVAFLASPRSAAITGDAVACGGGVPGSIYY
jgi:NAD(P)-dependent dehydrogenase (short-subunit alcohol dehydrogenase family)